MGEAVEGVLVAWLAPHPDGWEAALVASATPHRQPHKRVFKSTTEARAWVQHEAEELHALVVWQRI